MRTPLDWTHPLAGNRRFGIQQQTDGTWQFYTAGVDRCYDWYVALGNQNPFDHYFGFHDADAVWGQIQQSVINFVNSNQGQAGYFSTTSYAIRAEWLMVRDYLEGNITLQQLKLLLGCP